MTEKGKMKRCFVIAPIGKAESEDRRRSDQILKHIIRPIANECGYETVRADEISEPGIITTQIIEHILEDDLVIADLTDKNPNVFYELAVRHCAKKPIIQIIKDDEIIPFDVAPTRTIYVDHRDLDSAAYCKEELKRQIQSVETDPNKTDSPIIAAVNIQTLRKSENPLEASNAEIISMLQNIISQIGDISRSSRLEKHNIVLANTIAHLITTLAETRAVTKKFYKGETEFVIILDQIDNLLDITEAMINATNISNNIKEDLKNMIAAVKRTERLMPKGNEG